MLLWPIHGVCNSGGWEHGGVALECPLFFVVVVVVVVGVVVVVVDGDWVYFYSLSCWRKLGLYVAWIVG